MRKDGEALVLWSRDVALSRRSAGLPPRPKRAIEGHSTLRQNLSEPFRALHLLTGE